MSHHYHINLFWSDEESAWVADVPDLYPCTAFGATPGEAVAEAQTVIAAWLDVAREQGNPVPEPRYRPAIYTVHEASRAA